MARYLIFLFFLVLNGSARAQELDLQKASEVIHDHANRGFSGVILVAQNDQLLIRESFGKKHYPHGEDLSYDDRFLIASVSKQMTAAAILKLVTENKLRLDDPIQKFFVDYPHGDRITVHHLLSNSSGIFNYTDDVGFWTKLLRPMVDPNELIRIFSARDLEFEPGTRFAYSNSNYFLLGVLIEKISGQSYGQYLKQHFFLPAQMDDTAFEPVLSASVVGGYIFDRNKRYVRLPLRHLSWALGSGGIYSTVHDLLKWNLNLENHHFLNAEFTRKMHTPGLGDYGYGVKISRRFKTTVVWHSGLVPGYQSSNLRIPSKKLSVITLSNVQMPIHTDLAWKIAAALLTSDEVFDLPN